MNTVKSPPLPYPLPSSLLLTFDSVPCQAVSTLFLILLSTPVTPPGVAGGVGVTGVTGVVAVVAASGLTLEGVSSATGGGVASVLPPPDAESCCAGVFTRGSLEAGLEVWGEGLAGSVPFWICVCWGISLDFSGGGVASLGSALAGCSSLCPAGEVEMGVVVLLDCCSGSESCVWGVVSATGEVGMSYWGVKFKTAIDLASH